MRNRYLAIFFISCIAVFLASGCTETGTQDIETESQDIETGSQNIETGTQDIAETQNIDEQIKELEKKIQRAADVEAIKALMASMQWTFGLDTNVKKTPGLCFGQGDGYMYGNFMKRSEMLESSQMQVPPEGSPGGGPPGDGQIPPEGARGGGPPGEGQTFPEDARGGGPPGEGQAPAGGGHGGFGDMQRFHMLSTSIIEIAEDGQTAKAYWYTPGTVGSGWMYENYACDFVKEDGEWKTWHRTAMAEFSAPPDKSWTDIITEGPGGSAMMPSGKDIQEVAYEPQWSLERIPEYEPKAPVPYKTFSETFSYCPPMPKDVEEMLWREDLMF